jgi:3-oxoacyl-[acyl-carrier-protein] synthase III
MKTHRFETQIVIGDGCISIVIRRHDGSDVAHFTFDADSRDSMLEVVAAASKAAAAEVLRKEALKIIEEDASDHGVPQHPRRVFDPYEKR